MTHSPLLPSMDGRDPSEPNLQLIPPEVAARALSSHWFGDVVSVKAWNDIWAGDDAFAKQSRFDAFMQRNIVIVSILGGLAVVAVVAGIASAFGHG